MNEDLIKVKCKYEDEIIGYSECMNKFDCTGISNSNNCEPFYIDWVRFLLYKKHLIEVKE